MLSFQWDGLAPLSPGAVGFLKSPGLYQMMHFSTLNHKVSLSPAMLRNGFIQAKRKGLSLMRIPDTSHLSAVHTTLQKAFPGNCVPEERKPKQTKDPLIVLLGYNLQYFLMPKLGQEIQT